MKKVVILLTCIAFIFVSAAGCGTRASLPNGAAENESTSMDPLPNDKMIIKIRDEYNVNNEAIVAASQKKFPDVTFVRIFHCPQETQYELRQSLAGGSAEDIVISPNMKSVFDTAPEDLMDLSAEDFTENYADSALEACQIDGKLYCLP